MSPSELLNTTTLNNTQKTRILRRLKSGDFGYFVEKDDKGKNLLTEPGQQWLRKIANDVQTGMDFDLANVLYFRKVNNELIDQIKTIAPETFSSKEVYTTKELCELFEIKPATLRQKLKTMSKKHKSGLESLNPYIINKEGLEWLSFNFFAARYANSLRKDYLNNLFVYQVLQSEAA